MRMSFQGLYTGFSLIIPDTDLVIIGTGKKVRLISSRVVINAVDTLIVAFQGEMRAVWCLYDADKERATKLEKEHSEVGTYVCDPKPQTLIVRSNEAEAKTLVSLRLNLTIMT